MTVLQVRVGDRPVGTLACENHEYLFRYDAVESLDPERDLVSLTMPVRRRDYDAQFLHPPFQMTLPEGALFELLLQRFGKLINLHDDINLLQLVGTHSIGRLRFSLEGQEREAVEPPPYDLDHLLAYPEASALFEELLERYVVRSGVAGVQPKLLWHEAAPRRQMTVTTNAYIVKAAGRDFLGLPLNEFACLETSRAAGIPTCEATLSDGGDLLAIARFDRDLGPTGELRQLAFEEHCSLLHRARHGKYDASYEDVVGVVQQIPCARLQRTLEDLFTSIALSLTLRNGDAHLKNFGVLYDSTHEVWLAPTYDVVTTTVYIHNDVPALTMNGRKAWPDRGALVAFGLGACGLRKRIVERLLRRVEAAVEATRPRLRDLGDAHPAHRNLLARMDTTWQDGLAMLRGN